MSRNEKTNRLVLTALMICLVMLATFAIRVPSPFTQGYIHLGDSMKFLAVLLLGKKGGAVAGGLGSAMADMIPTNPLTVLAWKCWISKISF